jgi:hypothetical protein
MVNDKVVISSKLSMVRVVRVHVTWQLHVWLGLHGGGRRAEQIVAATLVNIYCLLEFVR